MILNKLSCSRALLGALFMLPVISYAGSPVGLLTFKVGAGKVSFDKGLNTSSLSSKGYVVNSYKQNSVDENSFSLSVSIPVTGKVSAELGLQKMGEVKSSLDVILPTGISAAQAAKDITEASPQQLGGLTGIIGANYTHPINHRVDLNLGSGLALGKNDHRITVNGEKFENDDSSTAPYLKLGFGVKLTPKFAITTQAERYFFDDSVDRYSIGLSYTY